MNDIAIRVDNLGKMYRIGGVQERYQRFTETVMNTLTAPIRRLRITEPTTGRAEIHGRVGSLLEVGTGFHPELTGRENVYLNGAT